uniref:Sphingomyelin phosphodiesterase 4 n=1 Tax=Globisporangium ultimum (strain ATCC 200006 / CBS 805.95 / DAOM BR144) TaxID=431595 RepID=K3WKR0_GLOUD
MSMQGGGRGGYGASASGAAGGVASASALQRQSSSSDSAQISYETDEEFAKALSSYDIPEVADALRRYLAFEVQSSLSSATSKQQSAQIKGKFYERFNQILDRVFGNDDVSKHKYGGWLDYSIGVASATAATGASALKKKRSTSSVLANSDIETYVDSLSTNGRALIRLLSSRKDDDGSIFQFLFRIAHPVEFKLELDMLPEQSKMSIMSRSAYTSVLFTQLLHKPLAKQLIDLRNPVLLVTIKELYLFYFLRHPASASHQTVPGSDVPTLGEASGAGVGVAGGAMRSSSSLMDSLSESFGKATGKRKAEYSWRLFVNDGFASLTKGNPYNVLLLQYLRAFLPETSAAASSRYHAKVLQHANLFLHILIEFWLRQNLIVFSDEPAQTAGDSLNGLATAMRGASTPTKLASPFAAVHTYTSYMAPSDDLLSSLLLTIIHLMSDPFYPAALVVTPTAGSTPSKNGFYPSLVAGTGGGGYLTTSVSVMRRPLYEFFRLVFSRAPIGLSPTAFLAITDVWLAYIQPWCCRRWSEGTSCNSGDAASGGVYSAAWETYVLANYHFYTVLLGGFVERAKELDFSGTDDRSLSILDRVLSVYTPELLTLLRNASSFLEKSQPFAVPYGGSGRMASQNSSKSVTKDELTPAQGHVLTYYSKALGVECTPVPIHGSFHRDAERLFDKLWSDSGISAAATSGNAARSLSSESGEKYLERVQRLSRSLRRVFEISDAYVSSTSHARSLTSSSGAPESFCNPSRDAKLPHLLTHEGVYQLLRGFRMCSPEGAAYIGDPMLRPICTYEIPWLVRASYRFSTWLNDQLGLQNPYHGKHFEDNLEVDPARAFAAFRFNFRFLASKVNLAYLVAFLVLLYALHLW